MEEDFWPLVAEPNASVITDHLLITLAVCIYRPR